MKYLRNAGLLILLAGSSNFIAGQAAAKAGEKQFLQGSMLVESNCVDCMGGSRAGLEQGVRAIEEALKSGYPDRRTAYKLLVNAYMELTTYTEKEPPVQKIYAQRRSEVLKKLVNLSPKDPEVLKLYADTLEDTDKKAAVLTRIIELDPTLTGARYELGLIRAKQGKTAAGIQMVEEAIRSQNDPEALRTYVQGLIALLDSVKCPLPDAERWNTRLNQAFDRATQGAGVPAALVDFRKGFLQAVGSQSCAVAPEL